MGTQLCRPGQRGAAMIGVVVPAHNEEALLPRALAALKLAAQHPALDAEPVAIVVVADSCCDQSAAIARERGVEVIETGMRNVGASRALGAAALIARGARWLAFTDADSKVHPDWLAAQLALEADAVCGPVSVEDWSAHGALSDALRLHFLERYLHADGHRHIHAANLGVSAAAYLAAGGFLPLACSEDVALVEALQRNGARIAWSAAPRVVTSARTDARARGGFGDTLLAYRDWLSGPAVAKAS
ncbi:glycosyltransferase [Uliginosibacterium sp. H1]|uniref:glycosyltransferase n=1 Tax=Uliginosibacterium sp. H1 TaxID=3114757 RepID=UPI002E1873A5|nr:glycosyltransferase [Uliginosibacterium sp. H1]